MGRDNTQKTKTEDLILKLDFEKFINTIGEKQSEINTSFNNIDNIYRTLIFAMLAIIGGIAYSNEGFGNGNWKNVLLVQFMGLFFYMFAQISRVLNAKREITLMLKGARSRKGNSYFANGDYNKKQDANFLSLNIRPGLFYFASAICTIYSYFTIAFPILGN